MAAVDTVLNTLQTHGLALLFPLAILEGPIVTVIAAYVARLGYLNIVAVYVVVVVADLVGDVVFYMIGRASHGAVLVRWGPRLGLNEKRRAIFEQHFREHGPRTIVIGKLTHSAGLAILLAAGAFRVPFWTFLWYNFLATLPKSLFFAIIGYTLGYAYAEINSYIFKISAVMMILALLGLTAWLMTRDWDA